MTLYNIAGFFVLAIFIKFATNFYKYKRMKTLFDKYIDFILTDNFDFLQLNEEIKSLFKDAGLKDSIVMHQEFLGFGQYANMKISVFDNICNRRIDIVSIVRMRFNEAIGVYKKRYRESFNPIFWMDVVVKLPKHLLEFLGVLPDSIATKVLLVIYWILLFALGIRQSELFDIFIK